MGFGKALFAKEFAKMILCEEENKPCNKCKSCIELENNNNPDLIEIEPENATIKIEKIREVRKQSARITNHIKEKSLHYKRCRSYDKRSWKLST